MKKLALILLFVFTQAHSATWIEYGEDRTGAIHSFDQDTITHHNNHGITFVVWNKIQEADGRTSKNKFELHCASKMFRMTYSIDQNTHGLPTRENNTPYDQFTDAAPDTAIMDLINYVCNHYR
jgi:hypothetical protein